MRNRVLLCKNMTFEASKEINLKKHGQLSSRPCFWWRFVVWSPLQRGRLVILLFCGKTDNKSLSPSLLWDASLNKSPVCKKCALKFVAKLHILLAVNRKNQREARGREKKSSYFGCSLPRKTSSSNYTLMSHYCAQQTQLGQTEIYLHGEVAQFQLKIFILNVSRLIFS